MYEFPYRDKFYHDEKDELLAITTSIFVEDPENPEGGEYVDVMITSDEIDNDSFDFTESITGNQTLNFQNCVSSYVKFSTKYIEYSLYHQWINLYKLIFVESQNDWFQIPLGNFYVVSDNLSNDGITQDIIAYDALYSVINMNQEDVRALYDEIYDNVSPVSIRNFRDYFFNKFDIEQENVVLINDDIVLPKQLTDDDLIDGGSLVKFIAELNGVFPHMGKDGILHWISLDVGDPDEQPLYPTFYPGYNTFPGNGYIGNFTDIYKDQYEENTPVWANYQTLRPDGVQIRNGKNEIVYFANSENSTNPYIVINNLFCNDLEGGQYQQIAERLFNKIKLIDYVPFQLKKMNDPCIEVGDRVSVHTQQNQRFLSYMFTKHTVGIRGSFEEVSALGTYELSWYDVTKNKAEKKIKNLDNRVGNIEKSGSGPLQIVSVTELPSNPQLNVLYLIQGTVTVN